MDVVALGLAAVKGTRHVVLPSVRLDAVGPVGDRRACLVDVERQQVLRTVGHRDLLAVEGRWSDGHLHLARPDGRTARGVPEPTGERLTCDYWGRAVELEVLGGPHAALLADHLGVTDRPVALAAAPPAAVVYGAPVSLVSTASLRDLGARAGRDDLVASASRFRMTMVVDAGDEPYAEDRWCGRELAVGEARLRVRRPVPRCAVVDLDPATGAKDGSLLKVLAGYRPSSGGEPWFGVDAEVVTPGEVRVGDVVVAP